LTPPDETTIIATPSSRAYRSCAYVPGSAARGSCLGALVGDDFEAVVAQLEFEEATDAG